MRHTLSVVAFAAGVFGLMATNRARTIMRLGWRTRFMYLYRTILIAAFLITAELACSARASADVIIVTPNTVNLVERLPGSPTVATFTDSDASATASNFSAVTAWGDGTTSADVITGGNGSFSLVGTHTYADEGTFTTATTVLSSGGPLTATGLANVAERDILAGSATPLFLAPLVSFSGTVGTFTDSDSTRVASDFQATINWGDGTTSVPAITGGNGSFSLVATHTYAAPGVFTTSLTISVPDALDLDTDPPVTFVGTADVGQGVPEPSSLTLVGLGISLFAVIAKLGHRRTGPR